MRCPLHPKVVLYEGMMETHGYCPLCNFSYPLTGGGEVEQKKTG